MRSWLRGHSGAVVLIAALVATHSALVLVAARTNFATVDEADHVASGLHLWQSRTFVAYRVNPPLYRALAALPVMAAGRAPRLHVRAVSRLVRPERLLGVLMTQRAGAGFLDLLFLARLAGLAWSLLGAWVVYRWTRELAGPRGALLALAVYLVEPNLLAHASCATPDVPAAVAALAASYAFYRHLRAPRASTAVVAGVALGVAELTKFTLVVLYPAWLLAWWLHRRAARRGATDVRASTRGQLALVVALSVLVINAGYGFQSTCRPLGQFAFVSWTFGRVVPRLADDVDAHVPRFGNRFAGSLLGRAPVPVPADYLLGIDIQRRDFESHMRSYLRGTWRDRGWWYYYLYAFAIKTPLGLLALGAWALARWTRDGATRGWRHGAAALAGVLPPLAIVALVSSQTGFNHHYRYVLPALPFAAVAIGVALAPALAPARRARLGVLALLVAAAASVARVAPHQLSYFNELVGGPARGSEHLVDSNVDWGQDLLHLQRWLAAHPSFAPLRLAYFGGLGPQALGLRYELPPTGRPDDPRGGPQPGHYAVSVNFVRGMRFGIVDGAGVVTTARAGDYAYFARLTPCARAGHSIWIYDVTPEDAARVRRALGLPTLR